MKRIWTLAMLGMFCPTVALSEEDFVEPENQEETEVKLPEIRTVSLIVDELTGGTVSIGDQTVYEEDSSKVVVNITVTPADGYMISKENLKLWAVLPLQEGQASSAP